MSESISKYEAKSMLSLQETAQLGDIFMQSGLFTDLKSQAVAITKIIAGQEIGLMPFQSMMGIDIIQGKTFLKPVTMAAKLKQSGRYDYRVLQSDESICEIVFFEHNKEIGTIIFTIKDAQTLNLTYKDNWKKQPKVMLYWRAMSQGIRQFCPDLYLIPIYNEADKWDGLKEEPVEVIIEKKNGNGYKEVIEVSSGEIKPHKPDTSGHFRTVEVSSGEIKPLLKKPIEELKEIVKPKLNRPYSPDDLKDMLVNYKSKKIKYELITAETLEKANINLSNLLNGNATRRKAFIKYIFGVDTSKDLTEQQGQNLINWIKCKEYEGEWIPDSMAITEIAPIIDIIDSEIDIYAVVNEVRND